MTSINEILGRPTLRATLAGDNQFLDVSGGVPVRLYSVTTFCSGGAEFRVYPAQTASGDYIKFVNAVEDWTVSGVFGALWLPALSLWIGSNASSADNRITVTYLLDP